MNYIQQNTKRGYTLSQCTSAMQKAIRRADAIVAGYFSQELFASGFGEYVWRRLLVISAEDVYGCVTKELLALYESYKIIRKQPNKKETAGRIFISKAIVLLCLSPKSRDADHLQCLVYDKIEGITEEQIDKELADCEGMEVPEYAYDCHTREGKRMGKTKADFFKSEQAALVPRQIGLFDHLL
jgi:replication-associated recombination protein RarA